MKLIAIAGVVVAVVTGILLLTINDTTDTSTVDEGDKHAVESTDPTIVLGLPMREGPRQETTDSVPHVQVDAEIVPEVDEELRRRVYRLPGVENLESDRSLPGARGLALADNLVLERPDVISGSKEFAHIHPDGSLHVWLPVDIAKEVDETKWGEIHPWVNQSGFWDGVVMLYTPESLEELEITIEVIVEAYNFITGTRLSPNDIP